MIKSGWGMQREARTYEEFRELFQPASSEVWTQWATEYLNIPTPTNNGFYGTSIAELIYGANFGQKEPTVHPRLPKSLARRLNLKIKS